MIHISYLAVLVAAVAAFIIGFMFHGPLFGKLWIRLAKITPTGNEKMSDMYGQMVWNMVVNLVTAYVLAVIYSVMASSGVIAGSHIWVGAVTGFLVWLGFIVTSTSIDVIWMGKSRDLWMFEFFSSFVVTVAMGVIIAAW